MDAADRQAIDDIFRRLEEVERNGGARDPEAEALIVDRVRSRPAYAYYLAQTVVAQQQALEAAQVRLDGAEGRRGQAAPRDEGFLSRIFGGGAPPRPTTSVPASAAANGGRGGWSDPRSGMGRPGGGGGFLAGAAQTAMGVAGGVILGNMLMNAFDGNDGGAQAAEPEAPAEADSGGDGGGDFGDFGGDF